MIYLVGRKPAEGKLNMNFKFLAWFTVQWKQIKDNIIP